MNAGPRCAVWLGLRSRSTCGVIDFPQVDVTAGGRRPGAEMPPSARTPIQASGRAGAGRFATHRGRRPDGSASSPIRMIVKERCQLDRATASGRDGQARPLSADAVVGSTVIFSGRSEALDAT